MNNARWRKLIILLNDASQKDKLDALLQFFLTIEEQEQLADRIALIQALLKGDKPQRQIAKELNVSIAKITRGSNMLKTSDKKLKAYLQEELC